MSDDQSAEATGLAEESAALTEAEGAQQAEHATHHEHGVDGVDASGLGRLMPASVRDGWPREDVDFTPWLRDNIDELFSQLGLEIGEITSTQSEVPVGPFKLDLLVEDGAGRRIAIENQLEPTDHSHLGQLLLYGAGLEADVLIWIATRFRQEHRSALDWLNARTDDEVHVFGVQVQLVRIGASPPAPIFDVVVEPNEWEEAVREASRPTSDKNSLRQVFFEEALDELATRVDGFRVPKAQAQNWQAFSSGPFGNYSFVFSWDHFRAEIYLDAVNPPTMGKELFDRLANARDEIEELVTESLTWERLDDDTRAARVYLSREQVNDEELADPEIRSELAAWAAETAAKLMRLDQRLRQEAAAIQSATTVGD